MSNRQQFRRESRYRAAKPHFGQRRTHAGILALNRGSAARWTVSRSDRLFIPQRHQRIQPRCPSGRPVAGGHGDRNQQHRNRDQRHRIRWTGLDQQTCSNWPTPKAPAKPIDRPMASCTKPRRTISHHTCGLRSKRHTDADLLCPLRDRVRGDRVQADRRQQPARSTRKWRTSIRTRGTASAPAPVLVHRLDLEERQSGSIARTPRASATSRRPRHRQCESSAWRTPRPAARNGM